MGITNTKELDFQYAVLHHLGRKPAGRPLVTGPGKGAVGFTVYL